MGECAQREVSLDKAHFYIKRSHMTDCSTLLWHLYGATASAGGLDNFRAGTRTLLGEYTDHFKRQRIVDQSREELKLEGSLGNAVHCSRLDRVKVTPGQVPVMELM